MVHKVHAFFIFITSENEKRIRFSYFTSMWTTGIAHLCSSGFVTDKIVLDRVMPRFGLCCTVFVLELSSFSYLVGVTDFSKAVFAFVVV